MTRPLTPALPYLAETASQTAGPFVHIGLIPQQAGFDIFETNFGSALAGPETPGERIAIEGRVFDGLGAACRDVLVELWQADAEGRYAITAQRGSFRGWGRTGTDFETGLYRFETIKPGRVLGRHGARLTAPHVSLWFVARGINIGLATRMYFSDEGAANADDPVLAIVEHPARRETLIGQRGERDGAIVYTFDIHLQGERETVFFDV